MKKGSYCKTTQKALEELAYMMFACEIDYNLPNYEEYCLRYNKLTVRGKEYVKSILSDLRIKHGITEYK